MLYQRNNPHGGAQDPAIRLDFSANTNPFGTPEGVLQALRQSLTELHRYPDPYCTRLIAAIAEREGVLPSCILCGNGAAELIYAYCACLQPGRAVIPAPSFSEYAQALREQDCEVLYYPLKKEHCFDMDADFLPWLEQAAPEVIFLCSPNNPTGRLLPQGLLEAVLDFCRRRDCRLFLDECFLDLSEGGKSLSSVLEAQPRLFILKAFTKSYGLAGLRLGYGLCAEEELLRRMSRYSQPWNVSSPAQTAGIAALEEADFLEQTRSLIARERLWLKQRLEALGFWVCPSHANYLLFQGEAGWQRALWEKGAAIRSCENYPALGAGWYRIAIRQHGENEELIRIMTAVREEKEQWQNAL